MFRINATFEIAGALAFERRWQSQYDVKVDCAIPRELGTGIVCRFAKLAFCWDANDEDFFNTGVKNAEAFCTLPRGDRGFAGILPLIVRLDFENGFLVRSDSCV